MSFLNHFLKQSQKSQKNNYAYYVLGDININLLNATNDSRIQQYIDTLCSLGCYPIINRLDSKKSCGHDDIPVLTLKLSKYLLAPLLSNVINESICDGVFPNNLKIAKVVPIFKTGDSEIPTNYRPISVLTYFSKILKRCCTEDLTIISPKTTC